MIYYLKEHILPKIKTKTKTSRRILFIRIYCNENMIYAKDLAISRYPNPFNSYINPEPQNWSMKDEKWDCSDLNSNKKCPKHGNLGSIMKLMYTYAEV